MNKPNLIFLHGALGSSKQFEKLQIVLSEFYEVHSINFSGHGGAPLNDNSFSINLFMYDVEKYMEQNEIGSAHFFGYSMGGYVAVSLASKSPQLINSIITLATKFDWTEESASKEIAMLDCNKMAVKIPKFVEELKNRHDPVDWTIIVNKTKDLIAYLGNHPLETSLFNNVNCKLKLMSGDCDRMVGVEETLNTYRKFKNAELSILPATPHPFELVNTERLVFEIKNFIN